MSVSLFHGSFVALITPFNRKKRIDSKALEALIEWHIQEGTGGIVCSATTGEGVVLSERERKQVAEICLRVAARRIPIIANTGTCDTRQSVHLTEQMAALGADGCLAVTPYYNKPSQKGCVLHFREIAKVGLPVIVYHNPARAVIRLTAETVAEIAQIPSIAAIKESSHDIELVKKIRKTSKIPIFSGEDDLTCSILKEGGIGSISVIGNLIPRGWSEMIRLALSGDWIRAQRLSDRYLPLCKALFLETNPQCIKWAMKCFGKIEGELRLPLILPEPSTQREIKKTLIHLSLPYSQQAKRQPAG
jgi:4-hydroxy-tetrahydrodipicolinate synthase